MSARSLEEFVLATLERSGARIDPADPERSSYRVELPERVTAAWARRGREADEALWIAIEPGELSGVTGTTEVDGRRGLEGPEPITPTCRRFRDVLELALDEGWMGVLHQPASRHQAALWALGDVAWCGGPLKAAPAPHAAVAWISLDATQRPPVAVYWAGEDAPPPALALSWGYPPGRRRLGGAGRRRPSLRQALELAAQSVVEEAWKRPDVRAWARTCPTWALPEIRWVIVQASLIFLDADAPWPPGPTLDLPHPPDGPAAPSGGADG